MNRLIKGFDFEERHLMVLSLAGQAWDRLTVIREILAVEGVRAADRFGTMKPHPLLAEERATMKTFAALLRELGLDLEAETPRIPHR